MCCWRNSNGTVLIMLAVFPIIFPVLGSIAFYRFLRPAIGASSGPFGVPFHAGNVRNPAVKSFFLFVPIYLVRLAVFRFSDFEYSLQSLYLRYLFLDYLGPFVLLGGLAFFMNRAVRRESPVEQYIGYLTFFTVHVVLFSLVASVSSRRVLDGARVVPASGWNGSASRAISDRNYSC